MSIFSLLSVPVTPSKVSISAGVSNRFASAACAIGGFVDAVVVFVVSADEPELVVAAAAGGDQRRDGGNGDSGCQSAHA